MDDANRNLAPVEPLVRLERARLRYRRGGRSGTLAVESADIQIRQGQFAAIVGPSGCGKSSLLKLIAGLILATEGTVHVGGALVTKPLKNVGMAFQNPTLLPWRTALDNVLLPLEVSEAHRRRFRANYTTYVSLARDLLTTVGLAGFEDKYPWELSGGMQQRVSLCRSLVHQPELLLLDEPFAALDAFTREELWHVLQELWLRKQFTVVLVTHDLREAAYLSDVIYVMSPRPGRIIGERLVSFTRPRTIQQTFSTDFVETVAGIREQVFKAKSAMGLASVNQPFSAEEDEDRPQTTLDIGQKLLSYVVMPLIFTACLFLAWEIICRALNISNFVLPPPSRIFPVLVENYSAILVNARQTAVTTLIGFAIGTGMGLLIGVVVGSAAAVYRSVYPTLIGLNTIPKIAVVPIFVVWFGYGPNVAILTAAVTCLFPVLVVVATSVATTEPELDDMLRSFGARKLDVLRKVSIPRAMPQFFGSVHLAIVSAFIGTVIAEMAAANGGLGYLMVVASGNLDMPLVFAGLLLLAAMGVVFYLVAAIFERRMTAWAYHGAD